MKNFESFVAWRFLLKGTERGKLSPMTLFAWLAIGVGVGAMCSLLSVMYGFEAALKERVLKAYPHVMVRPKEGMGFIGQYAAWTKRLQGAEGVVRVEPFLESEMIGQSRLRALGVVVWGLAHADLLRLKPNFSQGTLPEGPTKVAPAIVGSELARRLDLSVGDELRLVSPMGKTGPLGLLPQSEVVQMTGVYTSGHYDFDQQFLYIELEDAQELLKVGDAISGWHIWGSSVEEADRIQRNLSRILPDTWEAQSWTVFNSALFHSLKLEQYAMFTILCFAIAIAVMNIVITLMMHVSHKRRNIGILRALGASKRQVESIFIRQGAFLGAVGLFLGTLLTIGFVVYVRYFSSYQLPDIYYDRSIPIEIRPWSLAATYGVATVMIGLATLYPSRKAARMDPIAAIRE